MSDTEAAPKKQPSRRVKKDPALDTDAAPLAAPPPPPPPAVVDVMPATDERVAVSAMQFEAKRSRFVTPDGADVDPDAVFVKVGNTLWRSTCRVLAVHYPPRAGGRAVTSLMVAEGRDYATSEVEAMVAAIRDAQR
jgi:hypothetical protein